LFDNEKFDEAAMFFEKAQDIPSAMLSRAHSMLTLGRFHALEVQSKLPRLAHSGLNFLLCFNCVFQSFINLLLSDHEVALAHAVLKQNSEPSKAAYRAYHQAAEIFHQLQQFNMSAKAYKACGMFEEAIECLRAVRQYLPAFRLSFELKPLRTSLLIDIGTQGSLYRQLLESFFTHKLLFDNIDHCCQWIAELRDKHNEEDSKFCDAWLMASVSLLLDAQESGHHSNISHSISKLLKLSNPSVVQHTIDQLERDNNHKVAMLIREKIDSTGSAQRYRSTGHLFKASSVLATMLNENRPVEAADRPLKDELIESILVPIRVGFLLPLLVAYKPFLQHHVEFVSHSICQAREACPSDVHSLELDVVESLFQSFLSREKHLALQGDQRNSFGMENAVQLQGLLSAMSKQSKKSSHSNVIRLQTIILSELLNQLPLCWSVKGAKRLPAEFTNIDDWYQHCAVQYFDLLNNYQRSVALVKNNGNENEPYFQAVEKSFASFPGDSIYFRKLLLCNLDGRNSTVSDKVLLKLVNQKHNSDSTPIVFDPKQWDKLISVRSTKLMDVYVSFVRDLFLEASHRIETDTLDRFGSTLSSFGLYTGNKQFKLNDRHRSNLLSTLNLLCTVFQNGSSVALREFSKRIGWFVSLTRSFQVTSDSFDLQVPRLSEPFPLYAVHSNVILWQLLYNRAQHISKLETSPHISLNSMVEHFMLLKLLWPESSISSVNGLAAFSVLKNRVPEHVKHRREELEAQKKSLAAKAEKSKDDEGRLQKLEHQLKAMKATEASSQWFADLAYMLFQALQSQQNLVQSALAVKLFSVVDVKLAFDMKRLVNKNRFSQNVLLDSIMAGSQAVHDFYHQMIVSNFCAASITFDNVPHSACLSFPLFINLVSHLVVSLIYVYQRANCIVLPKSLIAEVMLQPWSKAYFEWLNISIAQSNSDHQLQYLETLESLLGTALVFLMDLLILCLMYIFFNLQ
jgi:tetratricopeptide (TPR) repeat protein